MICRHFQPLYRLRSNIVQQIPKKYIDTQTTSCYSSPCLSNPIPACLLLASKASSLRNLSVLGLSALDWLPNTPTFNLQTFRRLGILTLFLSYLLPTPTP